MNKLLIGAALSSMFWAGLASAAYQDEVLADGPVAYYRFEAGSSSATAVPTLAHWALAGMSAVLLLFGAYGLRLQRLRDR